MALLETRALTHRFPNGNFGIKDINCRICKGEFVVIAGANGSGKTVLSRHLNGILRPTAGDVLLDGKPVTADLVNTRRRIGLLFQDPASQIIGETVYQDTAFGPENLHLPAEEVEAVVKATLTVLNLQEKAEMSPYELSGGERQRLALAGILAMKPEILIFDEPFSGLDYPGVKAILEQILSLHRSGHTIIVITHDLEKILAHSTRLIILSRGSIAADEKPERLISRVEEYDLRRPFGRQRPLQSMTWLN